MFSPINDALSVLEAGSKRLATVADNVVNVQNTVSVPSTQEALKTPPKGETEIVACPNVDLADEFVEESQARHAFPANL